MIKVNPGFFFLDYTKNCSKDLKASIIMSLFSLIKIPKQITRNKVKEMLIIHLR